MVKKTFKDFIPVDLIREFEQKECVEGFHPEHIIELSRQIGEKIKVVDNKKFDVLRCRYEYERRVYAAYLLHSFKFTQREIWMGGIAVDVFGFIYAVHSGKYKGATFTELKPSTEKDNGNLHLFLAGIYGKKRVKKILEYMINKLDNLKLEDFTLRSV